MPKQKRTTKPSPPATNPTGQTSKKVRAGRKASTHRRSGAESTHGPLEAEVDRKQLQRLALQFGEKPATGADFFLELTDLRAGYGAMEILHGLNVFLNRGSSLCFIGPNGAGKSTVLHTLYGFAKRFAGQIKLQGQEIQKMPASEKLKKVKIAYIPQENSIFPEMTVEENLMMGGFQMENHRAAKAAAERVLEKYARLRQRAKHPARVLSGGERRLLEISRALVMDPEVLLVDEPSIGLEPRFIELVFEILHELKTKEKKTILLVEQNALRGLEFAEIGYVLVSGRVVLADRASALLRNKAVGKLFLGK